MRPNQQEIVINFVRDTSKNNLIYLFSNEGLPHLKKQLEECFPPADGGPAVMSIEVYNVIVCLNLMAMCCEGKSDMAEVKCQQEIVDI